MKSFSLSLRQTACLLLMLMLSLSYSEAQQNRGSQDHMKIFHFHNAYYDNVIDTAGNILFDENWSILMRAEECGKFLGIRMVNDTSGDHPSQFDGLPAEFALLSPDGSKTILPYREIGGIHEEYMAARTDEGWGVVDCAKKWIIQPSLGAAPLLYDKHILITEYVVDTASEDYPSIRRYLGLADYSGRMLAPAEYTAAYALDWWEKTYFVLMKNAFSSLVDDMGQVVIPPGKYYIFPSISDESVWVISESMRKVYYPATDEWITENPDVLTRGLFGCQDGLSIDLDEDGYDWMTWKNPDGSIRLYASPDHMRVSFAHPFLRIRKYDKYGVVTRAGRVLLPCIYDNIFQSYPPSYAESYWNQCVFDGTLSVELNGAWGLVDTSGNYLTHMIYDGLQGASEGIVAAEVGGKTGFIDVHGNKIIPFVFDWTDEPWEHGIGKAYLMESPFLMNRQGRILACETGAEGTVTMEMLGDREPLTSLEERFRDLLDEVGGLPDEVAWVNLMDAGLTSVPQQIKRFRNLENLDLTNNYISRIHFELAVFKDLEFIDLSYNLFEEFPQELLDIPALSILLMEENSLGQLPPALFTHPNLTEIHLAGNRIKAFPELPSRNKNIESLNLQNNLIDSLPPSIGNLAALKYLHLSGNQIRELPPEIGRMKNLVFLVLDGNQLEHLPQDLSGLKSLHTINLSNNRLSTIPESLLGLKSLNRIQIKGNPIPEEEINRILESRPDLTID